MDQRELPPTSDTSEAHLTELLNRIRISPELNALQEELRAPIRANIRQKIRRQRLCTSIGKWSSIAACTILLISMGWLLGKHDQDIPTTWITQEVPLGVKTTLMLSDGSTVLLNGGSKLTYPSQFNASYRKVALQGEGYFQVKPRPDQPFQVETSNLTTQVLGTTFNISAQPKDECIQITLETGRVMVINQANSHKEYLAPNQQLSYNKHTGDMSLHQIRVSKELLWRDNKFLFEGETLYSIAQKLERAFGTKIEINNSSLRDIRFSGEFIEGESLEQIIRIIATDPRIHYQLYKKGIHLSEAH